jgi:carbon storage regulator CsrA
MFCQAFKQGSEVRVMLVLTRKSQQAIVVGNAAGMSAVLRITVLEINRGQVRLGFDLSEDIPVHRAEVWEKIQAANGLSVNSKPMIGKGRDKLSQ